MSAENKTLAEDFNDYESMWEDSASWVTASGNKIKSSNNTNNKYKEKLQKLVDYHITDTIAHDAKSFGRWKPTYDMNLKTLDETTDGAFLTYSEKFYQGQDPKVKTRLIDAFYDKHTKNYKIRVFLDGKLAMKKEGSSFNAMIEELCFFFRGPRFGTPERQDLMEWVDSKGQKVSFNHTGQAQVKNATQTISQTTQPAANKVSQPPVVAKVARRKKVKNKFGILIDNWGPELTKLGLHIWDTCKKPADEKDSGVGPDILRIYFEMPNGEEWRLEVTNTGITLNKGIQVYVDWDYVISTDRNGKEVVVSRGKTKDYNEFLDILLGLGIIADKKKCV